SARADYALRACAELALAGESRLKREEIASRQDIPIQYLESVLLALKHAGVVQSLRGAAGGFRLARPPADISLADVIRAVDGPMADVRGDRPEEVEYLGPARRLQDIWVALRASLREILEGTSLDDLVNGTLSPEIERLLELPDAWVSLNRVRPGAQFRTATRGHRSGG
ncbi:MAG: Rrf2 family transcriptional regulator, partial [Chloroflexota bacterium]|nr:Rrf2 family transcriptional regulator [Chloroflexota bacterium]